MKLKYKFVVREVGGIPTAVAVGEDNVHFNGMVKLNSTGKFIFELLNQGDKSLEEITNAMVSQYDVSREVACNAVSAFIDNIRDAGLIEE